MDSDTCIQMDLWFTHMYHPREREREGEREREFKFLCATSPESEIRNFHPQR